MAKTKKRVLSLVLSLAMLLTLLPATALAAGTEGKVTVTKTLQSTEPDANGNYTIQLTVQGNPVTTQVQPNADVILVVDNSGSMATSVGDPCNYTKEQFTKIDQPFLNYIIGITNYTCPNCGARYGQYFWGALDLRPDVCTGQTGSQPRIDTAKNVGAAFADSILYAGSSNQMAVIGFSSDRYFGGSQDAEAINVSQGLTNSVDAVKTAINKMDAEGGTNYSAALQQAYEWISNRADQTRPAYVVFISDGAPGRSGESISDPAWNGSTQAAALKAAGVELYTIGIALNGDEAAYLSSLAWDADHYRNVTGTTYATELETILKEWASEINSVPAGTSAVLTDVVNTEKFTVVSASTNLQSAGDGKTFTWTIGDIPETAAVATIVVRPNEGVSGDDIPTNESVSFTYQDPSATEVTLDSADIGNPTVDIAAKYIPVTPVLTAQDKTYDGDTIVEYTEYTLSLNGVALGDDVTAVAASVMFEDEDAGYNKTVTATGITLTGKDAGKYELTTGTATTEADILQKPLTITITPKDRVFDGSKEVKVTIPGVGEDDKTPVGVIDGDDAYLDPVPTTGTMDTPDVGDGKKVEVRGPMLVGNDRNNYALIVNVDTVNIYPVDTNVVTVTGYTGMYNGQPQGVTASASLEGSTLLYSTDDGDNKTWSEAAPTFTNAGTYTVYVKATKANAADSPVASAQVVIGQRDVVLTSGSSSKTYDGLPLVNPNVTVSGSGFVAGEGAVYAVTGSQTSVGSSQNLFTYTLNAGTVATNYTITVRYGTLTVSNYIPPYIPPVDPGTDIEDPDVPLADLPGLNTKDHYAYIAGYPDGTVQPNGNITRAEVATIFFRLFTEEYRNTYWSVSAPFADVEATDWFNTEVATVASAGVVNGYPDGTFLPNNNITRAEFATIAARFLTEEYVGPDLFTDVSGHWAQEYINRAANAGWINGYPDGSFHPDAYITRAEAMTLVNNMLGRMPHEDHLLAGMKLWVDNPSTMWYYEAVQEATNGHDYDWAEDNSYEIWTSLTPDPDWEALEALWTSQNA